MKNLPLTAVVIAAALLAARAAVAQSADATCAYKACALGLSPRLSGLDVVRGPADKRVTSLNFFWPRDISSHFAESDSAAKYARRAVSVRQTASALTDAGIALFAIAGAKVIRDGGVHRGSAVWLGGGGALFAISFPLQLRADGELSRAVWWYNSRFTR